MNVCLEIPLRSKQTFHTINAYATCKQSYLLTHVMNKYVMLMRNEGTRYIAVWLENTKPCLEPTSPYCIEGGGRKCVLMYTNKYTLNVK